MLRPTGFHSALDTYVDMARSGKIPEIGDGRARTNPVSDAALATLCADAITDPARRSPARRELAVGGGEILSRREIGELAFAAIGAAPRFRHIPPRIARLGAAALRPLHPRIGQFMAFLAHVATHELIAPAAGQGSLADSFRRRASALAPGR